MINITKEALNKIKSVLQNNPNKIPRIILKKGGCAGNILLLILDSPQNTDTIIESNNIKFYIDESTKPYIEDITIYTNSILGTNIMIKNNLRPSCRCGKSFKS